MTDKTYFHIGLHKTASTWLQRQLFPNLEGIRFVHGGGFERLPLEGPKLVISSEGLSGTLSRKRLPGDSHRQLVASLARIVAWAPRPAIIVGFREHSSWFDSVIAQRAKKRRLNRQRFVDTFAPEELSWCHTLGLIEQSCSTVFPFLYEELARDPHGLVGDLCRFIGVPVPADVDRLVAIRENPSARSLPGQLVSRLFFQISWTRSLHWHGKRLGARVDRYFAPRRFKADPEIARKWRQDWNRLVQMVGERRGHDFAAFTLPDRADQEPQGRTMATSSPGSRTAAS